MLFPSRELLRCNLCCNFLQRIVLPHMRGTSKMFGLEGTAHGSGRNRLVETFSSALE